ncbi:MAG TPA: helix-turn-helix transcriptional regulator [Gammaproteobacteria bacterium]|nr:helix-turn-helix transcriptional regulator [Gammaproteobacteria bacterium]
MVYVTDKYPGFQKYLNRLGYQKNISSREYECLALMAHGKRIKEISLLLKISARTVDTYLINIKQKLKVFGLSHAIEMYWNSRECYLAQQHNSEKIGDS